MYKFWGDTNTLTTQHLVNSSSFSTELYLTFQMYFAQCLSTSLLKILHRLLSYYQTHWISVYQTLMCMITSKDVVKMQIQEV